MEIPFAFAFTAGLVATLNPCGFAMLPAYLSYFMGLDDGESASGSNAVRAVQVGAVVSAGFLLVFGLAGILITLGVRAVVDALPWIAMLVGIGVIGLGAAMLTGRELRVRLPKAKSAPGGRGMGGVFWFGVSYAVASLSCTLPVFLVVVAGTIPQLGFIAGVATFLVYGLGMSTLLLLVTLSLAFGKRALITRLRHASQHVNRVAGVILVLAGGYIVFFWATSLAGDGTTQPAAVRWVEQLSSRATNAVAGAPGVVAAVTVLVLAVAGLTTWLAARRQRARAAAETPGDHHTPSGDDHAPLDHHAPDQHTSLDTQP
ncbi:MAG: cytochrome c biogenesis CcdA family protein [Nitriliruptoraceae bacterium]